jgi:transcriptional regulator with XRE-family HTH domain
MLALNLQTMDKANKNEPFGKRLRRLRKERGLTQQDLADRAGLSTLGMLETRKGLPNCKTAVSLAEALEVDIDKLLGIEKPIPQALISFLESPSGKNANDEEREYLVHHVPMRCGPTEETYWVALQMLRTMENNKKP